LVPLVVRWLRGLLSKITCNIHKSQLQLNKKTAKSKPNKAMQSPELLKILMLVFQIWFSWFFLLLIKY